MIAFPFRGTRQQIIPGKRIFLRLGLQLTGALLLVAVVGALAVARGKQADPTQHLGAKQDGPVTEKGSPS